MKGELATARIEAEEAQSSRTVAETRSIKAEGRIEALETVIAELQSQLRPRARKHDAADKTKG